MAQKSNGVDICEKPRGPGVIPLDPLHYTYDPVTGGVTSETTSLADGNGWTVNYAYDPHTGQHTRTYTTTEDTTYNYDGLGRLSEVWVTERNGNPADDHTYYTYDAVGNLHTELNPSQVLFTYTYDSLNRLDLETADLTAGGTTTHAASFDYDVRSDGIRTGVTEKFYSDNTTFSQDRIDWTYDAWNRLTDEVATGVGNDVSTYSDHYTYDPAGNRLTKSHLYTDGSGSHDQEITYGYDADDRMLSQDTVTDGGPDDIVTFTYDANGNQTSDGFQYDIQNHLVAAKGFLTYAYDPEGERVARYESGSPTGYYELDRINPTGYSQVLVEQVPYIYTAAIRYEIGLGVIGGADLYSDTLTTYIADGHGSLRLACGWDGVLSPPPTYNNNPDYFYDAFGNAVGFIPSDGGNYHLYTGELYDAHLGMYHLRARDYETSTGRFTTRDPIDTVKNLADPLSLHTYVYANGNPVLNSDPSGYLVDLLEVAVEEALDEDAEAIDLGYVAGARTAAQKAIAWTLIVGMSAGSIALGTLSNEVDTVPERILRERGLIGPNENSGEDVPIYQEPADEFPHEAANALDVIQGNPLAALLHYAGDGEEGADKRRDKAIAYALKHQYGGNDPRTPHLNSLDEYPFASTLEGGEGANVVPAPLEENVAQGRDLEQFYRHWGFNRSHPAEPFLVLVVSSRDFAY